jgi:hypothetical protein
MATPVPPTKPLTPHGLASQLFDAAILQQGNPREAAMQVMRFLTEAVVYSISVIAGADEAARKGLLKEVGEAIVAAPRLVMVPGK